jgi:excisionase family DNA binding protein
MGVSIHTVRGWVYQRKIPYLKAGKIVRFIWADVLQWLHKKGA